MLTLKNIKKDYTMGDNVVHALRGVSLEFRPNEFVSILGASGCGKTTLLNIVGGLDRYSEGDLVINGVSTKDYKDKDWDVYRNHRIGFVFQSYNLIPHQTVLGNVELALTIAGVSKAERRARAIEALCQVGLGAELRKRPNQLSGGQMQRVAIARALVNNPEILLADEPTGALDNETSLQIMELIREIAGERLVIMVTHNPELAQQYSSRIVRLCDGLVVSDSNPYDSSLEVVNDSAEVLEEELAAIDEQEDAQVSEEALKADEAALKKAAKEKEKASMSYKTALGLSGRNLIAKKGRTAITSIAGSIGIIGVSLVLALRGGFTTYIANTEKDMLSAYPLTITETTLDYSSIMLAMEKGNVKIDPGKLNDKLYVNSFLTKLANNMTSTNTITQEYVDYLNQMDSSYYYALQYGYYGDIGNNFFNKVTFSDPTTKNKQEYLMSLDTMLSIYSTQLTQATMGATQLVSGMFSRADSVIYEMPDNQDYILSQYDIVAGEYPESTSEEELVLVLNNDGGMADIALTQLGLLTFDELVELLLTDDEGEDSFKYISFDEILEQRYMYYPNEAIYTKATEAATGGVGWQRLNNTKISADEDVTKITFNGVEGKELRIACVLRAKAGTEYGSLASGLAYMPAFLQRYHTDARNSEIVASKADDQTQLIWTQDFEVMTNVICFLTENPTDDAAITYTTQNLNLRLGGAKVPSSVKIYAKDFETKDAITSYLDRWNDEIKAGDESAKIEYTDTVALLMTLVRGMLDAVTYVLVAFTAISLVVSSVMIGVITYVSVVERTKEIGVLRSLGARKMDIRRLFNAETFLVGLTAGAFGVGITYALSVPINFILKALTGISSLAALPFGQAIAMVVVSVILTLISGLIPANAAAKKDPVIALRTE